MFITTLTEESQYTRLSKHGQEHSYSRKKTVARFQCDNCNDIFNRDLKQIDRKRLSNNYFHCCSNCDAKKFAQKKGVDKRKILDMPASSMLPVGKY
jgi:hypothetical protein